MPTWHHWPAEWYKRKEIYSTDFMNLKSKCEWKTDLWASPRNQHHMWRWFLSYLQLLEEIQSWYCALSMGITSCQACLVTPLTFIFMLSAGPTIKVVDYQLSLTFINQENGLKNSKKKRSTYHLKGFTSNPTILAVSVCMSLWYLTVNVKWLLIKYFSSLLCTKKKVLV